MRCNRITTIAGIAALMLAAINLLTFQVGYSQDAKAVGRVHGGTGAQSSRPLQIDGADDSIVVATVSGPEFATSTLFVGIEDPTHSRAKP